MAPSFCPFLHFSWSSAEQMEWSNKLYIDVKLYNLCITEAYPLLRPACQRAAGHGGPAQLWSVCQDEGRHYRRPETGRAQGGVWKYIFLKHQQQADIFLDGARAHLLCPLRFRQS